MYICICNAIRENDLRAAALREGGDAERVYASLGNRPDCRQCLEEADEFIDEVRKCASLARIAA